MIRAIAVSILALGFAGTALADRDHHRNDHRDYRRDHGDYRRDGRNARDYDRYDRYERPRRYAPPPRHDYRWQAPRPRGWYPGWREPYGRGYRYWNDNYYYVVPAPSIGLSLSFPLR